jgi:hypothetical protein
MYEYFCGDGTSFKEERLISTKDIKSKKVCSYTYTNDNNGVMYYVRLYDSKLYNPNDSEHQRDKGKPIKLRSVRKDTYDLYHQYLKTKRLAIFTQANRSL